MSFFTNQEDGNLNVRRIGLTIGGVLAGILLIVTAFKSFTIIDGSEVGVVRTFGAIDKDEWQQGFHFKIPFVQTVEKVNTQLVTCTVENAEAASKDLQRVTTSITLQHNISPSSAAEVTGAVGDIKKLDAAIVNPAVHECLKAVTARYTAEELVTKREHVKIAVVDAIKQFINETLRQKNASDALSIANVAITDFNFSPEFNASIELKVKAEQDALRAEREKTGRVTAAETLAIEKKKNADAKAYDIEQNSIKRAEAITREALALGTNPDLINLRAIELWDGVLPTFAGGPLPLPIFSLAPPTTAPAKPAAAAESKTSGK